MHTEDKCGRRPGEKPGERAGQFVVDVMCPERCDIRIVVFGAGVYFSHPWADFLLLIDEGNSFFPGSPSHIYPYKLLLRDQNEPSEFLALA